MMDNPQYSYKVESPLPKAPGSPEAAAAQQKLDMAKYFPNAKPVGSLSTDRGADVITKNIEDHNKDMLAIGAPKTSTVETPKETAVTTANPQMEQIGGLTAEEAKATGTDLTNYTYDSSTKYFIPKTSTVQNQLDLKYEAQAKEIKDFFEPYIKNMDAANLQLVDSIKKTYADRINEEKSLNADQIKAVKSWGIRSGVARYSGQEFGQIISDVQRKGLEKITQISNEETKALAEANQALLDKKYSTFVQIRSELKDLRKEKQAELTKLQDRAIEELKYQREVIQKAKDQFNKDLNSIMTDAGKNFAPPEVIDAIKNSTTVADAVKAAGEYLQSGTGVVGEYAAYKRDSIARGLTPLSFDEYQTRDANRKLALAKAATNAGGLTTQENQTFLTITNKFQADPIINSAVKAGQIISLADQVIADPNNATNQLASLYMFVKNLDPESAVREGELSLANQTQTYLQRFGNSLARVNEGRVLSPDAAKELAEATKKLVATWQSSAEKKTKLYKSQANNSSPNVGTAFNKYIKDSELIPTTDQQIMNEQSNYETKVTDYVKSHPDKTDLLAKMAEGGTSPQKILEYMKLHPETFGTI